MVYSRRGRCDAIAVIGIYGAVSKSATLRSLMEIFVFESLLSDGKAGRSRAPICADFISGMRSLMTHSRKSLIGLKGRGEIGSHISTCQPHSFAN